MTIDELKDALDPRNGVTQIRHVNNKTVSYWPLSIQETADHAELNGYWVTDQLGEPLVKEVIKIKKTDLPSWNVIQED